MSKDESSYFRFSLLLKEIDNLRSTEGVTAVALALIQLDGMEEVNERFGYLGGDKVLQEFAARLAGVVGNRGSAFEITGTSFALLLQNPLHEGDAVSGAEKIATVASEPVIIGTGRARVHARMGISLLPEPAATAEELLRQCEIALAEAREHGETYRVFTPGVSQSDPSSGKSWFDIDRAIDQGEFELHYQPRIDLRSGRLTGTEALIRWQSPRAGTIPPSYFLPDITSAEGVRKMLTFVLNTALADAKEWSTRIPDFTLSINLAAKNLADPDLYRVIETALEKWDFPGDQLILEARSEFIIENEESVIVSFSKLRNLGIRIAIDDFGSSGLSVTSLKTLPIDMLKIDKSFVVPMPSNETDRRIVGAIVQLAHAVNLEVIAEGIEDADIMQALLAVGCEAGEGFHFSRPIPAAEFGSAWVEKFSNKRVSAV